MKKGFLPIALAIIMILSFIPFGRAAKAEGGYTASFGAQFDPGVNADVGEWPDLAEYDIAISLGAEATIVIEFDSPVKFGENYAAINTDVPFPGNKGDFVELKLDGVPVKTGIAYVNGEGTDGGLRLTLCNKWNDQIIKQPVDLASLGEFSKLELSFVVSEGDPPDYNSSISYSATLMGQLDTDVSTIVGEWEIESHPGASVEFSLEKEATISMTFDEPIKFSGNWTGISTDYPISGDAEAEELGGKIVSFKVDGNDLGSKDVPLIDRDNAGFLTIDIARQWGGSYDEYDLAGMDPFSTLEITFIVGGGGSGGGADDGQAPPTSFATSGKAWIGGTFISDTDSSGFDWVEFGENNADGIVQVVDFELGVPFTVTLDFGDGENEHGEASWGYMSVVQTDIQDAAAFYSAYIYGIKKDGSNVRFYPEYIEVGFDRGVRVSLANSWAATPVIDSPGVIGKFSKLEVTIAFVQSGEPQPDLPAEPEAPPEEAAPPAESSAPPPVESSAIHSTEPVTPPASSNSGGGLPSWAIGVIIGGGVLVVVVVVVIVVKSKGKSN